MAVVALILICGRLLLNGRGFRILTVRDHSRIIITVLLLVLMSLVVVMQVSLLLLLLELVFARLGATNSI